MEMYIAEKFFLCTVLITQKMLVNYRSNLRLTMPQKRLQDDGYIFKENFSYAIVESAEKLQYLLNN